MQDKIKPNEIYIERIYEAPLEKVWDAWVNPHKVAQWWGPRGFTITNHSKEVRTGGHWNYTMHGPDGVDYPNRTQYLEVKEYVSMIYDHGANETQPPLFRVTVHFISMAEKTRMEMIMALPTPEAAAETKKFIKKVGGNSTWDRLAEFLVTESTQQDVFIIHQTFNIQPNLMFEMWTNPQHLENWTGPAGAQIKYLRADIRPGGNAFYCMAGVGDTKIYGRAEYREIIPPHCIVYTQCFCDEKEKLARHPLAPTWPSMMMTKILLEPEGADKTRVGIHWKVFGEATAIERETFHNAKAGMAMGWSGSFDKLEEYLAK